MSTIAAVLEPAGLALSVGSVLIYALRVVIRRAPFRTSPYEVAAVLGAALAAGGSAAEGGLGAMSIAALATLVVFFATLRLSLRLPTSTPKLAVGARLPAFVAATTDGAPFTSADLVAAAPALLVVFRGHW